MRFLYFVADFSYNQLKLFSILCYFLQQKCNTNKNIYIFSEIHNLELLVNI